MKIWETLYSVPIEFLRYQHPRCYPQSHTFGPTPAWGLGIRDTPPPSENVPLGVSSENVPIREEDKARDKLGFLVFLEEAEIRGQRERQTPDHRTVGGAGAHWSYSTQSHFPPHHLTHPHLTPKTPCFRARVPFPGTPAPLLQFQK